MAGGFNPLQDLASILGSLAKLLPPLPSPPFPLSQSPMVEPPGGVVESPSAPSDGAESHSYVDITDSLMEAVTESQRAAQEAKGLVIFNYE